MGEQGTGPVPAFSVAAANVQVYLDSHAHGRRERGEQADSITSLYDLNRRRIGSIVGLAVGDAVGTTNEFSSPGSFAPIDDMVGGGPFRLPVGAWTDDTSMALCLAESLIECGGFDVLDQMHRYLAWWRDGHLSSTGRCFDIGNATRAALRHFEESGDPIAGSVDPDTAGNGSIMRLAPVVAWFADEPETAIIRARESSVTTHGAAEAVDGCELLARLLLIGYAGGEMDITMPLDPVPDHWSKRLKQVAMMEEAETFDPPCRATGYVVNTLACARWAVARATSFREAVLLAANLGDDADTVAAVVGQIAGARWGFDAIPPAWVERLVQSREIVRMAEMVAASRARNR